MVYSYHLYSAVRVTRHAPARGQMFRISSPNIMFTWFRAGDSEGIRVIDAMAHLKMSVGPPSKKCQERQSGDERVLILISASYRKLITRNVNVYGGEVPAIASRLNEV